MPVQKYSTGLGVRDKIRGASSLVVGFDDRDGLYAVLDVTGKLGTTISLHAIDKYNLGKEYLGQKFLWVEERDLEPIQPSLSEMVTLAVQAVQPAVTAPVVTLSDMALKDVQAAEDQAVFGILDKAIAEAIKEKEEKSLTTAIDKAATDQLEEARRTRVQKDVAEITKMAAEFDKMILTGKDIAVSKTAVDSIVLIQNDDLTVVKKRVFPTKKSRQLKPKCCKWCYR